jgi:hypothetical protein
VFLTMSISFPFRVRAILRAGLLLAALELGGRAAAPAEPPSSPNGEPDLERNALLLDEYLTQRDEEYISYVEALDLTPESRDHLWRHLTRKYRELARLNERAESMLGGGHRNEVDLLVITYDPESDYVKKLESLRAEMDMELRELLTDAERERHRQYRQQAEEQRYQRRLRHYLDDMELGLTAEQYVAAEDILRRQPQRLQEAAPAAGAAGYSADYVVEQERSRFHDEQRYLLAHLAPMLTPAQKPRFLKWQEAERVRAERNLERYKETQRLLARFYPEYKRQIKLVRPRPDPLPETGRTVYVECRGGRLHLLPIEEITALAIRELKAASRQAAGNPEDLIRLLAEAKPEIESYQLDVSSILQARFRLVPRPGTPLADPADPWFEKLVESIRAGNKRLTLLVRDDSRRVFQGAMAAAQAGGIPVSEVRLADDQSLLFWLSGVLVTPDSPAERADGR